MPTFFYAPIDLSNEQDIQSKKFSDGSEMVDFVIKTFLESSDSVEEDIDGCVCLVAYKGEVLVSENPNAMTTLLGALRGVENNPKDDDFENLYLHLYWSYESAYQVALLMKETSSLCYE